MTVLDIDEENEKKKSKSKIAAIFIFIALMLFVLIGGIVLFYINKNININALEEARDDYAERMEDVKVSASNKAEYDSLVTQLNTAIEDVNVAAGKDIVSRLDGLVATIIKASGEIKEYTHSYDNYSKAYDKYIFSSTEKATFDQYLGVLAQAVEDVDVELTRSTVGKIDTFLTTLETNNVTLVTEQYNELSATSLTNATAAEGANINSYKTKVEGYISEKNYIEASKGLSSWQTIVDAIDLRTKQLSQPGYGKVIVIDPGHQEVGNSEKEPIGPGATETKAKVASGTVGVSTGIPEYKFTLTFSMVLKAELEKRGYTVIMTRETNDVNLSNSDRAKIANDASADAFLRIHGNGSESSSDSGILTMCPTANNPYCSGIYGDSKALSSQVLNNMVKATGARNVGVKETDTMSGINWSQVPVSIVECGFMSNPTEDQNMSDTIYQGKMATGIADGLDAYFAEKAADRE